MISVIIPAYNEEDAIKHEIYVIQDVFRKSGNDYEIIVVDDGSTDRTAEIADGMEVRLIRHRMNRGVGAARKTGILAARGEKIITTDGDGTYPNHLMPQLVEKLNDFDMVVGARTGKSVARSWIRWPAKWFIRRLACYLTHAQIPDLNSGLRAFHKSTALKYFYLLPDSHSWEATITLAYMCNHHSVEFIPVDYYRRKGKSSFHPFYDTYNYISLVIRTTMYFNPLRIFIPFSIGLGLIGFTKMSYDFFVYHHIGGFDVVIMMTSVLILCIGLLADLMVVLHKKLD